MPAKKPADTLASLRRRLAAAEAVAGDLRDKLAKAQAAAAGTPPAPSGLDLLWDAALPMARQRSSKQLCRKAWAAIPAAERPTVRAAIDAIKCWNRCEQWAANDHIYVPGLHRYISARMWECPPDAPKAKLHRNMSTLQPIQPTRPEEQIIDPAEIAKLLGLPSKPAPATKPARKIHTPQDIAEMLRGVIQ